MTKSYRTPTYMSWEGMNYRCRIKTNPSYERYGGKGITVCDEWKSFENFLKDMGEKPKGSSLDRIDNNKNYCKDNCKWSSIEDQNNNRSNSNNQTYQGKTQSVSRWARELNLPRGSLVTRMFTYGEDFETAVHHVRQSILKRKLA